MPVVTIDYTCTATDIDPLRIGSVYTLSFVPHIMGRPATKTNRIDRKGIGATETTLLYRESRVRVAVRCIPIGVVLDDLSGADQFEEFFMSASDGQSMWIDTTALPHYTTGFFARLAPAEHEVVVDTQAAKTSSVSFELELPRTR